MNVNKIILIFLLLVRVAYAQTFTNTVTIQKDLRVQGETVLGGVSKLEDITMYADTIHIGNLDGTGTLLGISGTGKVTRVTGAGAGGVTGLTAYQPLFGSLTGIIEQDNLWYYDPTIQYMRLGNPAGGAGGEIGVVNGTAASSITAISMGVSGSVGQTIMDGQYFSLYDLDADLFSIGRATWSTDEVLLFPAAKGALNQSLQVSNVTGDNVTLSWFTPTTGTVTSFTFTDGSGFDGTVTNSTTTPTLALTTTVSDNRIMYSNSGALNGYADFTYDDATELFDVNKFHVLGATGAITLYEGNTPTDGELLIGDAAAGEWQRGNITSSDITVTNLPNEIGLSISGLDATKISDGSVTSTEFQYINTLTSNAQTQLDSKTAGVGTAVHLTGQNAAIAATTAYTTPAADGMYQINWVVTVTTAATTSSQVAFQFKFTNAADNVVKTFPASGVNSITQSNANTTGTVISGTGTMYCKASTNIQYVTAYTSSGATAMQYSLDIQIVKL